MWDTYEWYLLFHCGAVLRGKCTGNSVRHSLCKTLLDCNGMEGSSSISSLGHWTIEAWVMNWVIWYIYERCLLCHGGAVLRGGRKPIAAWWPPSSTSGSMAGPQWNRRSFFHFPQLSHLWTDEAWAWRWVVWTATHACSPWRHLQVRVWCMPTASTGVSTSSGDVTAGGADPTALSRIEEYHSSKLRWLDNSNIMSTIPLIIRAPNPNNQGFLSDLLMLKRPPGPRVRDVPSSTRRLPKKSSSVFRLPAIITPQRRRLLDGTVWSNQGTVTGTVKELRSLDSCLGHMSPLYNKHLLPSSSMLNVGTPGLAACWLCSGWHVSPFPANFRISNLILLWLLDLWFII